MDMDDSTVNPIPLKRPREPFSDIEENVHISEEKDGQKRRRLEVSSRENWSPKPFSSLARCLELEVKPDTPALPSVRQLIQKREGMRPLAQRCLSDPGYQVPSIILQGLREDHLGGEAEFHAPSSLQTNPCPVNFGPRNRSSLVSDIHKKLQSSVTPSSKQVSRIRQEREEELRLLRVQPISDNVWLKRSCSDSSLAEADCDAGTSLLTDGSFTDMAAITEPPGGHEDSHLDPTGEENPLSAQVHHAATPEMLQVDTDTVLIHQQGAAKSESCVKMARRAEQIAEVETAAVAELQGEGDSSLDAEQKEPPHYKDLEEQTGDSFNSEEEMEETTLVHREEQKEAQSVDLYEEKNVEDKMEQGSCEEEEELLQVPREEEEEEEQSGQASTEEEIELSWSPREEEELVWFPREKEERLAQSAREEEEDSAWSPRGKEEEEEEQSGQIPSEEEIGQASEEEEEEELVQSPREEDEELPQSPRRTEEEVSIQVPREEEETGQVQSANRGLKKVAFILEPELINDSAVQSELDSSLDSRGDSVSELSSHDETNTAEMIDQMFEEVLEMAVGGCQEDHDSGIATGTTGKDGMEVQPDKEEKSEEMRKGEMEGEHEAAEDEKESQDVDTSGDELLSFPPNGILSPLSKSVEAVVTPLRLAASQLANPALVLVTPQEQATPPPEPAPLYSIDAYRTQRQSAKPDFQSVTPGVQRQDPKTPAQPSINTKDRIMILNEEAGKLQTVISQTLQALSCCTDEVHGRGSLEEAEAEKLLLVSSEKRAGLLAEVTRLKATVPVVPEANGAGLVDFITQGPCRGTVSISSIQLPLKVEFVCSARNCPGRPSHYFFVLIRYGACNIFATPLATAADAMNGDTISFPTAITLQDIRSTFEIDVEVYSLSHASGNTCPVERSVAKSRVTPRKLLNTFSKSNHSMTSSSLPALNTRRTSNFCLVGSHQITLTSLGQNKFALDKMKFEGKIRKLLGDEFQEKVPFLSPLEGNIYLRLDSEGHSNVQHHGFLTMFEVVHEFGAWHRRFFVLEGGHMSYWNHPNDRGSKAAEGSISLSSSSSQTVKLVKRDACARPFTFELVSNIRTLQQDGHSCQAKCWFCADTREEQAEWMDKLNQVLLDVHTWSHSDRRAKNPSSSSGNLRESLL